jgi:hypothetical protein
MLMRSDDGAIDHVNRPIQLASGLGLLLQGRYEVRKDTSALPAVEATRDGAPRTIPFGQIAPGSASAEEPEDPMKDRAVVMGGAPDLRFLRWEQWLQPLPWRVR